MRSFSCSLGRCLITKFFTLCNRAKDIWAICEAWWLCRSGRPDTTIYASPIVSTLYTLKLSTTPSNAMYKSFNNVTTWNEQNQQRISKDSTVSSIRSHAYLVLIKITRIIQNYAKEIIHWPIQILSRYQVTNHFFQCSTNIILTTRKWFHFPACWNF